MTVTRHKDPQTVENGEQADTVCETVLLDYGSEGTTTCRIIRKESNAKEREKAISNLQEVCRRLTGD